MRLFDVQGVEIRAPRAHVFEFIRNPANLTQWAHAFKSVHDGLARLETPAGVVDVRLEVLANADCGTVDWRMEFPDGSVGIAHSRAIETPRSTCVYTFVLQAPPVALEEVEGALEAQQITLRSELATLKEIIER